MVDQFLDKFGGERAVEDERVPMALVHVVTGDDRLVFLAEDGGALGVALEIDGGWKFIRLGERKHFPAHLVNQHIRAEGRGLHGTGLGEKTGDDCGEVHVTF